MNWEWETNREWSGKREGEEKKVGNGKETIPLSQFFLLSKFVSFWQPIPPLS